MRKYETDNPVTNEDGSIRTFIFHYKDGSQHFCQCGCNCFMKPYTHRENVVRCAICETTYEIVEKKK